MKCPFCPIGESRVIDTRAVGEGIRRRRECQSCGQRFTTYERIARTSLMVVKNDGRREEFDQDKLFLGLKKACAKRPVSIEQLDQIVSEIEAELYSLGQSEVPSKLIGEKVMEQLAELDDVAYVRFASVYRRFADLESLAEEIQKLKQQREREAIERRQLALGL
ncbi:MAG: transcriptional regulator NrdR [Ardenticatenaceae bacterium]|nr:transcriptional regulator NrdR [Ardenticatenaceae bacterium]HBY95305.1 transcriptional regulator NrdR [Chloroflexota bacterium]